MRIYQLPTYDVELGKIERLASITKSMPLAALGGLAP